MSSKKSQPVSQTPTSTEQEIPTMTTPATQSDKPAGNKTGKRAKVKSAGPLSEPAPPPAADIVTEPVVTTPPPADGMTMGPVTSTAPARKPKAGQPARRVFARTKTRKNGEAKAKKAEEAKPEPEAAVSPQPAAGSNGPGTAQLGAQLLEALGVTGNGPDPATTMVPPEATTTTTATPEATTTTTATPEATTTTTTTATPESSSQQSEQPAPAPQQPEPMGFFARNVSDILPSIKDITFGIFKWVATAIVATVLAILWVIGIVFKWGLHVTVGKLWALCRPTPAATPSADAGAETPAMTIEKMAGPASYGFVFVTAIVAMWFFLPRTVVVKEAPELAKTEGTKASKPATPKSDQDVLSASDEVSWANAGDLAGLDKKYEVVARLSGDSGLIDKTIRNVRALVESSEGTVLRVRRSGVGYTDIHLMTNAACGGKVQPMIGVISTAVMNSHGRLGGTSLSPDDAARPAVDFATTPAAAILAGK